MRLYGYGQLTVMIVKRMPFGRVCSYQWLFRGRGRSVQFGKTRCPNILQLNRQINHWGTSDNRVIYNVGVLSYLSFKSLSINKYKDIYK